MMSLYPVLITSVQTSYDRHVLPWNASCMNDALFPIRVTGGINKSVQLLLSCSLSTIVWWWGR